VIDLHTHVLPGIDDGPRGVTESIALCGAQHAAGVRTVVATPHVSRRYPNDADGIARRLTELQEALCAQGAAAVELVAGAEVASELVGELGGEELRRLALAGRSWLLLEPPLQGSAAHLELVVDELQRIGLQVLLAHPERCAAFHRDRRLLERLVDRGARCSLTAGSLVGTFGRAVERFAAELAAEGFAHTVASDAHDTGPRSPGLREPLRAAGLESVCGWLTEEAPARVLAGEELPARVHVPGIARRGARRRLLPFIRR